MSAYQIRNQAFDALPIPLILIDAESMVADMNPQAEALVEQSAKTAHGKQLNHWLLPSSTLLAFIETAIESSASRVEQTVSLEFPHGKNLVAQAQIVPLEARKFFLITLVINQQESARLADPSLKLPLTTMVGMLAHEIKNPLSGIKGAAQLLELSVDEKDVELAQMIVSEVDRLDFLLKDMEVLGDDRPLAARALNIHEILIHCRTLAETGFASGIQIDSAFDPSLPEVKVDKERLTQVILNLLKNAAEAVMPFADEGRIHLATSFFGGFKVKKSTGKNASTFLRLSIQDNGVGVSKDMTENLFEPGISSKAKGKGFGLALAKKIITDHQGWIEFSSEPRRTKFDIFLPISVEAT